MRLFEALWFMRTGIGVGAQALQPGHSWSLLRYGYNKVLALIDPEFRGLGGASLRSRFWIESYSRLEVMVFSLRRTSSR